MDLESLTVRFASDLTGLTSGVMSAKTLLAGFGVAALGLIYKSVLASPALPQAEKDAEAQAQAVGGHVASQLGAWLESRLPATRLNYASIQTSIGQLTPMNKSTRWKSGSYATSVNACGLNTWQPKVSERR